MKNPARQFAKSLAVKSGALTLYDRLAHRRTLTVLMFHRVLPASSIAELQADPEYTISTALFEELLKYLVANYALVDTNDLLASRCGARPLPTHPLLVTFDDGWNDNFVYAAPLLAAANIPWTLFVATDAISPPDVWWQEVLLGTLRSGRTSYEELWKLVQAESKGTEKPLSDDPSLSLLLRFGRLPRDRILQLLEETTSPKASTLRGPHMVDLETLRELHRSGVSIGVHGASHLPLTGLCDPQGDIGQAAEFLAGSVDRDAALTISFPHGRYNKDIVKAARASGMQLMFSSDPVLSPCPGGWLHSDLIGRLPISTRSISDDTGALDLTRLVPWLAVRPTVDLLPSETRGI